MPTPVLLTAESTGAVDVGATLPFVTLVVFMAAIAWAVMHRREGD